MIARGWLRLRGFDGASVVVTAGPAGVLAIDFRRQRATARDGSLARRSGAPSTLKGDERRARAVLSQVLEELEAYFRGELQVFRVPLDLRAGGTPFQRRVWRALLEIPYGAVESYGEVAARVGLRGGARAVGGAVGRNPLPVIVPCHRVVGSGGRLTGFSSGLDLKVTLLGIEGIVLSRAKDAAARRVVSWGREVHAG